MPDSHKEVVYDVITNFITHGNRETEQAVDSLDKKTSEANKRAAKGEEDVAKAARGRAKANKEVAESEKVAGKAAEDRQKVESSAGRAKLAEIKSVRDEVIKANQEVAAHRAELDRYLSAVRAMPAATRYSGPARRLVAGDERDLQAKLIAAERAAATAQRRLESALNTVQTQAAPAAPAPAAATQAARPATTNRAPAEVSAARAERAAAEQAAGKAEAAAARAQRSEVETRRILARDVQQGMIFRPGTSAEAEITKLFRSGGQFGFETSTGQKLIKRPDSPVDVGVPASLASDPKAVRRIEEIATVVDKVRTSQRATTSGTVAPTPPPTVSEQTKALAAVQKVVEKATQQPAVPTPPRPVRQVAQPLETPVRTGVVQQISAADRDAFLAQMAGTTRTTRGGRPRTNVAVPEATPVEATPTPPRRSRQRVDQGALKSFIDSVVGPQAEVPEPSPAEQKSIVDAVVSRVEQRMSLERDIRSKVRTLSPAEARDAIGGARRQISGAQGQVDQLREGLPSLSGEQAAQTRREIDRLRSRISWVQGLVGTLQLQAGVSTKDIQDSNEFQTWRQELARRTAARTARAGGALAAAGAAPPTPPTPPRRPPVPSPEPEPEPTPRRRRESAANREARLQRLLDSSEPVTGRTRQGAIAEVGTVRDLDRASANIREQNSRFEKFAKSLAQATQFRNFNLPTTAQIFDPVQGRSLSARPQTLFPAAEGIGQTSLFSATAARVAGIGVERQQREIEAQRQSRSQAALGRPSRQQVPQGFGPQPAGGAIQDTLFDRNSQLEAVEDKVAASAKRATEALTRQKDVSADKSRVLGGLIDAERRLTTGTGKLAHDSHEASDAVHELSNAEREAAAGKWRLVAAQENLDDAIQNGGKRDITRAREEASAAQKESKALDDRLTKLRKYYDEKKRADDKADEQLRQSRNKGFSDEIKQRQAEDRQRLETIDQQLARRNAMSAKAAREETKFLREEVREQLSDREKVAQQAQKTAQAAARTRAEAARAAKGEAEASVAKVKADAADTVIEDARLARIQQRNLLNARDARSSAANRRAEVEHAARMESHAARMEEHALRRTRLRNASLTPRRRRSAALTSLGRGITEAFTGLAGALRPIDEAERGFRRMGSTVKNLGSEIKRALKGDNEGSFGPAANSFRNFADQAGESLRTFSRHLLSFRTLILAAVVALGPFVAVLGALGGVALGAGNILGSLAGVVLALPAAFSAAGAAVGALVLAFSPLVKVIQAFTAYQQVARQGTATAAQNQLDAANKVRDAQDGVRSSTLGLQNAEVSARRSQVALNEARRQAVRDLEDLHAQLDRAGLDEAGAILAIKQAEADYRRTLADSNATQLDRESALLRVKNAEADLVDVRRRNKRLVEDTAIADKRGVEGNLSVVDARQAQQDAIQGVATAQVQLAKAQRDLVQAQKEQTAGGSAALDAYNKLQDALGQLGPKTRLVVEGLLGLSGAFRSFQQGISEAFFGHFTDDIGHFRDLLSGNSGLSALLRGAADALGEVADKGLDMVSSGPWSEAFRQLAKTNTQIINNIGDAALSVATAFKDLAVIAAPFTVFLSGRLQELADRFSKWVASAEGAKTLTDFFTRTARTVDTLGRILGNVGTAIWNVFNATAPFADWLLGKIEAVTMGWKKWSESLGTNPTFMGWLANLQNDLLPAVWHLLEKIAETFANLASNPEAMKEASAILRELADKVLPAIEHIFTKLSEKHTISDVVTGIGSLLDSLSKFIDSGGAGAIDVFVTTLVAGFTTIAKVLSAPGIGTGIGWLLKVFAAAGAITIIGRVLLSLAGGFWTLSRAVMAVVGAVARLFGFKGSSGGWFTGMRDKLTGRDPGESKKLSNLNDQYRTTEGRQLGVLSKMDEIIMILRRCCGMGGMGGKGVPAGTTPKPAGGGGSTKKTKPTRPAPSTVGYQRKPSITPTAAGTTAKNKRRLARNAAAAQRAAATPVATRPALTSGQQKKANRRAAAARAAQRAALMRSVTVTPATGRGQLPAGALPEIVDRNLTPAGRRRAGFIDPASTPRVRRQAAEAFQREYAGTNFMRPEIIRPSETVPVSPSRGELERRAAVERQQAAVAARAERDAIERELGPAGARGRPQPGRATRMGGEPTRRGAPQIRNAAAERRQARAEGRARRAQEEQARAPRPEPVAARPPAGGGFSDLDDLFGVGGEEVTEADRAAADKAMEEQRQRQVAQGQMARDAQSRGVPLTGAAGLTSYQAQHGETERGAAVRSYAHHGFSELNELRRTGTLPRLPGESEAVYQGRLSAANARLSSVGREMAPLKQDLELYRGIRSAQPLDVRPGHVFTDEGLQSTSMNRARAEAFAGVSGERLPAGADRPYRTVMQIGARRGTPGVVVGGAESEVLLNQGRYRVEHVQEDPNTGVRTVRATQLSDEEYQQHLRDQKAAEPRPAAPPPAPRPEPAPAPAAPPPAPRPVPAGPVIGAQPVTRARSRREAARLGLPYEPRPAEPNIRVPLPGAASRRMSDADWDDYRKSGTLRRRPGESDEVFRGRQEYAARGLEEMRAAEATEAARRPPPPAPVAEPPPPAAPAPPPPAAPRQSRLSALGSRVRGVMRSSQGAASLNASTLGLAGLIDRRRQQAPIEETLPPEEYGPRPAATPPAGGAPMPMPVPAGRGRPSLRNGLRRTGSGLRRVGSGVRRVGVGAGRVAGVAGLAIMADQISGLLGGPSLINKFIEGDKPKDIPAPDIDENDPRLDPGSEQYDPAYAEQVQKELDDYQAKVDKQQEEYQAGSEKRSGYVDAASMGAFLLPSLLPFGGGGGGLSRRAQARADRRAAQRSGSSGTRPRGRGAARPKGGPRPARPGRPGGLGRTGGRLGRLGGAARVGGRLGGLGRAAGVAGRVGGRLLAGGGVLGIGGMVLGGAADAGALGQGGGKTLGKAGGAALTGAGIGAAIGSIVPGVGTAIGAGVGAAVGVGYSLFKDPKFRKQVEDFFSGIGRFFADIGKSIGEWFGTHVAKPVANFFRSIGRWFAALPGRVGGWINENLIKPITNFFSTIGSWLGGLPGRVGGWINDWIITPITNFFSSIGNWLGGLPGRIGGWINDNLIAPISNFFSNIGSFLTGLPSLVKNWARDHLGGAGKLVAEGLSALGFAQGGVVPGSYDGRTDSIMARVTPGEYVVRRDRVNTPGGQQLLEDFNQGRFDPSQFYAGLSAATAPTRVGVPGVATNQSIGTVVTHNNTANNRSSGLSVGTITINNPVRERSELSMRRTLQSVAYFTYR